MNKGLSRFLRFTITCMALIGIILSVSMPINAATAAKYIFLDGAGVPIGEGDTADAGTKWASGKNYGDVAIILQKDSTCYIVYDVIETASMQNVVLPYPKEGSSDFDGLYGWGIEAIGLKAFENATNLETIVIPRTVGKIHDYAFIGCTSLQSVTIAQDSHTHRLNSYGKNIFDNCTSLKSFSFPYTSETFSTAGTLMNSSIESVTFESGITKIPKYACANAAKLTSVTYPDTVTSIEQYAFQKCTSLSNFTFKNSITVIGASAFASCEKLESVSLPESLKEMGAGVFSNSGLKSVVIPASLEKSGSSQSGPFKSALNLTNVEFAAPRTAIPDSVLAGATAVNSVSYPDTVTSIGNYSFFETKQLTSVPYLNGVTSIGNSAFQRGNLSGTIALDNCVSIGNSAFYECTGINAITFGNKLTTLGNAIIAKTAVTNVDIPVSVTKCGNSGPFQNAANLVSASFMGNEIPDFLFSNAAALETIHLSDNVTRIGKSAFLKCALYTDNSSFSKVTYIGDSAFEGCTAINNPIDISNVTYFGTKCFNQLANVSFTGKFGAVTNIGANAFDGCVQMAIPVILRQADKTTIGNYAFRGTAVSAVDLNNCNTIGSYAFIGCPIKSINITGSCKTVNSYAFAGCSDVTAFSIGDSEITKIGEFAFFGMENVKEVVLPPNLDDIGAGSFGGCAITSIKLPATIRTVSVAKNDTTALWHGPFTICKNLNYIEFEEGITTLPWGVFYHFCSADDMELTVTIPSTVTEIKDPPAGKNYPTFGSNIVKSVHLVFNDNENSQELASKIEGQFKDANSNVNIDVTIHNNALVKDFVRRLYSLVLLREADEAGLTSWTNALIEKSSSGVDAGYGFVFSLECIDRNLSDDAFVEMLYNTFMDRPSDGSGKAAWVSQLEAGVEREKILEGFIMSQEFAGICEEYQIMVGNVESVAAFAEALAHFRNQNADLTKFVARCYQQALGRDFEDEGLEAWCKAIITKENTPKQVAQNFIFSDEFVSKNLSNEEYVKVLYRTFMGREADEGGLAAWTAVLDEGREDREKVLDGFSDSAEFADILESYGLN